MDQERLPPRWAAAVAWIPVLGRLALATSYYRVTHPAGRGRREP